MPVGNKSLHFDVQAFLFLMKTENVSIEIALRP